jgi:hypothetical protein
MKINIFLSFLCIFTKIFTIRLKNKNKYGFFDPITSSLITNINKEKFIESPESNIQNILNKLYIIF